MDYSFCGVKDLENSIQQSVISFQLLGGVVLRINGMYWLAYPSLRGLRAGYHGFAVLGVTMLGQHC